ncbi:hypothetical protein [Bradyrhizobium guangzhouense]|uniref:hypothetical protein n=1 Tax=Bradyrhizobium guangzhouense TaxID=1325095 RepID=UPI001FDFCC59|nr:hypothetical protein [Bradyrhizobium guangzhouense]
MPSVKRRRNRPRSFASKETGKNLPNDLGLLFVDLKPTRLAGYGAIPVCAASGVAAFANDALHAAFDVAA